MQNNATVTVAAGRPLLEFLDLCYEARRPPLLKGGTGVGKSTLLAQFAQEKKISCICRDLSLMEPPDLVGMPKLEGGRTRFLPPAFLPTEGKGLLVLEEVNRAPEYMRAPCLMLLTDRRLNDYRLPDGWLPVAAVNPAEDGYEAAELDPAYLTRFVQVHVVADRDEWLGWAEKAELHPKVVSYVRSDPSVFQSPLSNPRSWEYVSDLLRADRKLQKNPCILQAAMAGCVGPERAAAFLRSLTDGVRPFTAKDILGTYRLNRKTLKAWVKECRLDLVEASLLNVEKQLQSRTEFQVVRDDKGGWKNLGLFLADLPGDLHVRAERFFHERKYPLPSAARREA